MAENFLTKKLGPQPRWAWGAEAVGAFLLFRFIRARQSASSGLQSITATPLTGGTTIPTDVGGPTTTASSGYSTLSAWITAALGQVSTVPGYTNTSALNDLTAWLNGGCVSSQGFSFIGNFIASGGLPPGFSTPPTLSVCPSTGTQSGGGSTPAPPPAAPAPASATPAPVPSPPSLGQFTNTVLGNVISTFQSGTGWVWVTDQGYVYASPGAGYFGGTDGGAVGGPIASKITQAFAVTSGPNAGGYTLVASNGDTYTFGPNANYSPL